MTVVNSHFCTYYYYSAELSVLSECNLGN